MEIQEIAQQIGMSATTVSRALSGKGRVGEETQRKIMAFIEERGIEPNIRKSKYTDKKTMNIAVVLPGTSDYAELPFFTRILMTLYDFFYVRGYNIIPIKTSEMDIKALQDVVKKHKVDGVILTRILGNCADIDYLKEKEIPFVVTGTIHDENVYQVDVDQRGGCRDLTNILFKTGIRKTALFCSDMRQSVMDGRYKGYIDAIQENELPMECHLVVENAKDENVLEKAVGDALKEQIECIICSDDGIAVTLLDYLRQLGVVVPRDVRVASFFNSMILEEANSSITSIDFDVRELGKTAGTMLMKLLEGEECEKRRVLGYRLMIKESTMTTKQE